jgi:hypothetical protein
MSVPNDVVFLQWLIDACGYHHPKPLLARPGRYACIVKFAFTYGIVTGRIGDRMGYADRWCYSTMDKAKAALDAWDGAGEPIGWHRHPNSGRRVSESPHERDENGFEVGASGVAYVRP